VFSEFPNVAKRGWKEEPGYLSTIASFRTVLEIDR